MSKTVKITYRPANIRGLGPTCQLLPGKNEVPLEVWETYKDAPEIAQLVDDEEIVVHDAPPAKRGRKAKQTEQTEQTEPEGDESETIGSDEA